MSHKVGAPTLMNRSAGFAKHAVSVTMASSSNVREGRDALPASDFIEDVGAWLKGRPVEQAIKELNERYGGLKVIESQLLQRKARLLTKLPEIQKARDMVVKLIDAQGQEMTMDFELSPNVYSSAKVSDVQTVNLWLGAGVMVEYPLEEARELLETNLSTCKANLATVNSDVDFIKESMTTTEVSIARVYNHDVEQKRQQKEAEAVAA